MYKDLLSSIFLIRFLIEQLTYRNKICFGKISTSIKL